MKLKTMFTLAAVGLTLSTPALAQDAKPLKKPVRVQGQAEKARGAVRGAAQEGAKKVSKQMDESVQKLEEQVLAGDASPAAFKALREQVQTLGTDAAEPDAAPRPKVAQLNGRLERRIADVEKRAQEGRATKEDFSILREQMIDARLELAIARVAQKAQQSGAEREDFARLTSLLEARAEAAKQIDPQATQENQKIVRTLNAIQKKSTEGGVQPVDFKNLRASLAEARLDRAMADLEKRAVGKNATPADYARVNEVLEDRTEAIGTPDAKALQERLQNAIAKLQAKADSGAVTPEEFSALRDNLVKKAREAGVEKK